MLSSATGEMQELLLRSNSMLSTLAKGATTVLWCQTCIAESKG